MVKKFAIICMATLISSTAFADEFNSSYISDGSDIVKHDVKKTNKFRIKIVFNDTDKGDIIPSINEVGDNMYGEYKVFKTENYSYRLNIQMINVDSKVFLLANSWKIPIGDNVSSDAKITNIYSSTRIKTTDKMIIKLKDTPIKFIIKGDKDD